MSATEPKPPRVTKRRVETRRRMVEAAMQVFAEKGFGRTSVEDVCTRAGYSRGAFYSNFVSLDELFLTVWQERSDAFLAVAEAAADEIGPEPAASLEDELDRALGLVVIDESWIKLEWEFTAHALRTSGLREVMAKREERIAKMLIRTLSPALARFGRRIPDPEAFVAALVAVHDGTAVQVLLEPDSELARSRRRNLFLSIVNAFTEHDENA